MHSLFWKRAGSGLALCSVAFTSSALALPWLRVEPLSTSRSTVRFTPISITLFQLHSIPTSGWNTIAPFLVVLGACLMLGSGIVGLVNSRGTRGSTLALNGCILVGAALLLVTGIVVRPRPFSFVQGAKTAIALHIEGASLGSMALFGHALQMLLIGGCLGIIAAGVSSISLIGIGSTRQAGLRAEGCSDDATQLRLA
jgi:hypothetical protein